MSGAKLAAARLFGSLLVLLAAGRPVAAGEAAEAEELSRKAAALAQRLEQLAAQAGSLESRRAQLENELAVAALRLEQARTASQLAEAELASARKRLEALSRQVEEKRQQFFGQLGALRSLQRAFPSVMLAAPWSDPQKLVRVVTLLLAVASYHKLALANLAALEQQQAQAVAAVSQKQEALRATLGQLTARRRELLATRQRVLAELAALEAERRQQAVALSEVQEAQGRLERLWGRVAGESKDFAGQVRLLKGGLPWPVEEGQLLRGFGKQRDPRYATVVLHPGWDLAAPPGAEVRAVAPGKVVYAQYFKSLGNLVILAHGDDLYTLYGRLATMFVSGGQRVAMGEPLGLAGPSGPDGNLYFELRNGTKAQDPAQWLRPARTR